MEVLVAAMVLVGGVLFAVVLLWWKFAAAVAATATIALERDADSTFQWIHNTDRRSNASRLSDESLKERIQSCLDVLDIAAREADQECNRLRRLVEAAKLKNGTADNNLAAASSAIFSSDQLQMLVLLANFGYSTAQLAELTCRPESIIRAVLDTQHFECGFADAA